MISYDIKDIRFRSFIDSLVDKQLVYEISYLKSLNGQVLTREELDLRLSYKEKNFYLMNDPGNVGQQLKYGILQKEIGFTETLEEIKKYEFLDKYDDDLKANDSGHRVFVHEGRNEDENIFKILFLDPNHLLAVSRESENNQYWNYDRCKEKVDCISNVSDCIKT